MISSILVRMALALFLLSSLALGSYDPSGSIGADNLSMVQFENLGTESLIDNAAMVAGVPQAAAQDQGTELAAYANEVPPMTDIGKALPIDMATNSPMYIFYDGNFLGWNDFSAAFPGSQPGLWIERAAGWSWYATLPLGGWTRELIYVPQPSLVALYEIYPEGFVREYNLGFSQPGYRYIWYYADSKGRHMNLLRTNSVYSNVVIVDVYPWINPYRPKPQPTPDPKTDCERNPLCSWVNGQCLCTGWDVEGEKRNCLKNPYCRWTDEGCICDDPEEIKCEQNPMCDWVNGICYCRGIPEPEPEPMPGPVPNPNPEPEPFNPAPNPVAQCEQNPSCHWSNGQCYCTGFNPGYSPSSDDTEDVPDTASSQ